MYLVTIAADPTGNHPVNTIVIFLKAVVTEFVSDHYKYQQAGCDPYCQSRNIYERIDFMANKVPNSYPEIVSYHGYTGEK
jgi:hypothetical protein